MLLRTFLAWLTACSTALVTPAVNAQAALANVAQRTLDRLMLLDVARAGRRVVAVGEHGHIVIADDPGKAWRRAACDCTATLTAVAFADDKNGWAVGHDALIVHSSDGGLSWQQQHIDVKAQAPLLDVWFSDARHGFAVGAYGVFLETRDGGQSWQTRRIAQEERHLNAIAGGPDGRLYVAGEGGLLYASDDLGEHWRALASPYQGSFFGVLRLPGQGVLAFGMRGHIFRSGDGGVSWQAAHSETTAFLMGGAVADDGAIVLAGLGATLLVSRDQGASFTPLQPAGGKGYAALLPPGRTEPLLVVGEGGVRQVLFNGR